MATPSLHDRDTPAGLVYGLIAYIWWGIMPLYLFRIRAVPAGEILGFRIVTALVVLMAIVAAMRRGGRVIEVFSRPKVCAALLTTTILVAINWYVYTYAISVGKAMEASLGYFLQPLLNAAFGVIFFRERFRVAQLLAMVIAIIGMVLMVRSAGELPWIAVTLLVSFGIYSLIRKITPVDGLVGLTIEIILLFPIALAYLFWLNMNRVMAFSTSDAVTNAWLLASGFITSIPMVFFGQAARRLRLSTLGFLQYISPSIQFLMAFTLLGEQLDSGRLRGFLVIWLALAIYTLDSLIAARSKTASASPDNSAPN